MSPRSSRLELLGAAVLFSTGGVAIKALPLTGWQVVCGRSAFAAVVLVAAGGLRWRDFSWRPALVGAAQAATLITFVIANKLTTAANAVFLQSTAPLYIALLGPFLLGERVKRRDIPLLAVIFTGILLLFAGSNDPLPTAPHRVLGSLIGVVSGMCWSLTVMGLRWVARTVRAGSGDAARAAAVMGSVMAGLVAAPAAIPFPALDATAMMGVAYLGIFQVGAAYLLLSRGLRHVPAAAASLLLLAEPALSPLWAWLVHHEAPGFWPLVGGILILAAATTATWRDSREVAVRA
jgi:drug/metabolite transporter (DMT)-like permease